MSPVCPTYSISPSPSPSSCCSSCAAVAVLLLLLARAAAGAGGGQTKQSESSESESTRGGPVAGRLAEEVGRGLSSMSESEVQRSMTASDIFRPAAASAPPVGATASGGSKSAATNQAHQDRGEPPKCNGHTGVIGRFYKRDEAEVYRVTTRVFHRTAAGRRRWSAATLREARGTMTTATTDKEGVPGSTSSLERTDAGLQECALPLPTRRKNQTRNVGRPNERRSARVHTLPRADEPMPLQQIMLLSMWPRRHHRLRMHSACTSATKGLRQVCRT